MYNFKKTIKHIRENDGEIDIPEKSKISYEKGRRKFVIDIFGKDQNRVYNLITSKIVDKTNDLKRKSKGLLNFIHKKVNEYLEPGEDFNAPRRIKYTVSYTFAGAYASYENNIKVMEEKLDRERRVHGTEGSFYQKSWAALKQDKEDYARYIEQAKAIEDELESFIKETIKEVEQKNV